MESSASESISNAYYNLERLSHSSPIARPVISTLEILWKGLDHETFHVPNPSISYNNVFCKQCDRNEKQFDRNEHFSRFEFSSAGIKIGVWISSVGLVNN